MTMTGVQPERRAVEYVLLGVLACLWGSSYLLIKVALTTIPPITLIALRVVIAALFLLAVMWAQGLRLPTDRQSWRLLLLQALCNSILPWTLLAWGQQYVDSSLASVLNSTAPLFVVLGTLVLTRHETPTKRALLGAALGMSGTLLVVGADAWRGLEQAVVAQLAVLFSAVLYAAAALHGRRLTMHAPVTVATGTMLWSVLFLVPLSLVVDAPWRLRPTNESLIAAIGLGVLSTGVALTIYFRLIRTLGALGVASQSYLRAGIGVALGLVVAGEQLTVLTALGLGIILVGVIAINARRSPTQQQKGAPVLQ